MDRVEVEKSGFTVKALTIGIILTFIGITYLWGPILSDLGATTGPWSQGRGGDHYYHSYFPVALGLMTLCAIVVSIINQARPNTFSLQEFFVMMIMPMTSIMFFTATNGYGAKQFFLDVVTMPVGLSYTVNPKTWWPLVPYFYGPHDTAFWKSMVEGSTYAIPWGDLAVPIAWFSIVASSAYLTGYFLTLFFRRSHEIEDLPYPTANMVFDVMEKTEAREGAGILHFFTENKYFTIGLLVSLIIYAIGQLPNEVSWAFFGRVTEWQTANTFGIWWSFDQDFTPLALLPSVALLVDLQLGNLAWGLMVPIDMLYSFVLGWVAFHLVLPVIVIGAGLATPWSPGAMWRSYESEGSNPLSQAMPGFTLGLPFGMLVALAIYPILRRPSLMITILKGQTPEGDKPPMSYRYVWIALIVCALGWIGLAVSGMGGMAWQFVVFIIVILTVFIGYIRYVAETGGIWGSKAIGPTYGCSDWLDPISNALWVPSMRVESTQTSIWWRFMTSSVSNNMGQGLLQGVFALGWFSLHNFKVGNMTKTEKSGILKTTIITIIFSAFLGTIIALAWWYIKPMTAVSHPLSRAWHGSTRGLGNTYTSVIAGRLQGYNILDPRNLQGYISWLSIGIVLTFAMSFLRGKFIWFRFAPSGIILAVLGGEALWAAFIVAAVVKMLILRIGGAGLFEKKGRPLAVGLMAGCAIVLFLKMSLSTINVINTLTSSPGRY